MKFDVPNFAAVAVPESLIATKILPPEFGAKSISRLALVKNFFSAGSAKKVLCVVAAVGSGKSTLLAEMSDVFLRQGDRVCWLNLDAEDNNPSLFAAYFVYALQAFDQTLAQSELAQLRGNQTHELSALFDRLLVKMTESPNRCILFLDDFQHLTDPVLLKIIDRFIALLPANVKMVIASRTSLPLELSRLKVSGMLQEIEQESLNLGLSGVVELMSRVHGLDLSASDLEALQSTTEGWMAGLQLAALALQSHPGPARELIDGFSGRDKDLASYLLDCVLKHLAPDAKAFLMATSPLRRMCAELCDVVTESTYSQATLESMYRSKLFLVPMDRNGLWYRYHHLFGDFLQTELRRDDPARYRKTCDIAALWCEGKGQTTEAIQYALDGGNFACATELIARYALELSQKKGDHFTILEWMRRLPVVHQNSRPEILLSHAWSLAFSRHDQPARALVEQAMGKIADRDVNPWSLSPAESIRWDQIARVTLAVVNAASDQLENCLDASLILIEELPEDDAFSRASVGNCMAYCHFAKREFSACAMAASNAQLQGQRAAAEFATGWACFLLGLSELELGRATLANEQSERLERCAKGSPVRYLSDLSNLLKSEIASHMGDFDRASDLSEIGKTFPDFFGAVEPMFLAIRGQARAMEWVDDFGAALRTFLQGQDLAVKLQKPRLHNLLIIEEIGLRLNTGDVIGASVALERHGLQGRADKGEHPTDRRFQILEIRIMLAGNRTKEAHSLLRNVQRNAGSISPCLSDSIAIHALKSLALWMDGKNMEAARELDCAFGLLKDGASLYWLFQMGTELRPLLEFLKNHRGDNPRKEFPEVDRHIETVLLDLIARKGSRPKEVHRDAPICKTEYTKLTKKERRVIALIEVGMSNEQIAKELFLSEATVKWHLHNVYSKLDVKSRTAAVAYSRKLALL